MNCTVKIANVYSRILEEAKPELVVYVNNKIYIGVLFFERTDGDDEIQDDIDGFDYNGDVKGLLVKIYGLLKKHNMIANDDKTFKTMAHWQDINGLTKESMCDLGIYEYNTDTELFNANGIVI